ncbi:MAG: hypothetical protein FWD91_00780 [Treponema sp.]|nr:hypothetical protein [Treponema sp.]
MLELNGEETALVEKIKAYLNECSPEETVLVNQRFRCLAALGEAVSQYPSIRESNKLRGIQRDEGHLLSTLCSFASPTHLLHIPARVAAARSYQVAKFQAFSLLYILLRDKKEFYQPLRKVMLTVIHTLMAEEVYFSCLDDPDFSQIVKINLAYDLISLWDSGNDPRAVQHLSALDALWSARDAAPPPCFGTMNASSELMRVTMDMDEGWQEFIIARVSIDETRWALEEFLFGLSYEEITSIRLKLAEQGENAVGRQEIDSYLGGKPAYGIIDSTDCRSIYDFYVDRRDTARFRKRTSAPGPHRTLEEIYLKYRIAQE